MFRITCPLCRENYVFINRLCARCDKIRHMSVLYGMDKVVEILEKILVLRKFKPNSEEKQLDLLRSIHEGSDQQ